MIKKMSLGYEEEGDFMKSIYKLKGILDEKSKSKVIKHCVNNHETMIDTIKYLNRKIENLEKENENVKNIVVKKQRADMMFNKLYT